MVNGNNRPFSTFSLAYMRGHLDVAKAVLEIAQAQYAPKDKPRARYRMQTDEESEGSVAGEGDDDEPKIYGEIIDDRYTVENIGQVSMQVQSRNKPLDMLGWVFPAYNMKDGKIEFSGLKTSLLEHIILENDRKGLQYYHDLTVTFASQQKDEDDEGKRCVAFPQSEFWLAVKHGRLEILADMIKWGGAGLPLERLVKKTGLDLKEEAEFYQGLTVYGRKRKDWATAGRQVTSRPKDIHDSPVILAAQHGSLESVEWFLSNAPLSTLR